MPPLKFSPRWSHSHVTRHVTPHAVPSEWETLLKTWLIDEAQVEQELGTGSVAAEAIREWVRQNLHRVYVPEAVLQILVMGDRTR